MPSPRFSGKLLRNVAIVWVLVLVFGSLIPEQAKVAIGTARRPVQLPFHLSFVPHPPLPHPTGHRLFHLISFGATTFLLSRFARSRRGKLLAAAGVLALGLVLEFSQMWIYHSGLEIEDIRDDFYGVATAYVVVLLIAIWERTRRHINEPETVDQTTG
jgi:hypothetical protein